MQPEDESIAGTDSTPRKPLCSAAWGALTTAAWITAVA